MLTTAVVWLNRIAGAIAGVVLAPVAWLPGWLSATLIAIATGIGMLVAFKYTSHQAAIKRTRDQIKANLLALSLFKDDLRVGLRSQGRILFEAGRLLALSLVPMLVMLVPMCLALGQLALWYQARPLAVGEEAVVTVRVADGAEAMLDRIALLPSDAATVAVGPVRVPAKKMACWNIKTQQPGMHELAFELDGQRATKQLAIGDRYMPVSLERPSWNWSAALVHPHEPPFAADSPVQSIEVVYPERSSWTSGTDWWLVYWFAVSMVAAFVARPFLGVNI